MCCQWKLMCILAHPDDETLGIGGTIAKYVAQGVEVYLVVATRGEYGWLGNQSDNPGKEALGRIRERELREAIKVLGVYQLDFLGYTDGELDQANVNEAIRKIVHLLRQIKPHVVVTFGPDGLYGHPDHIAISQFTTAAIAYAVNPDYFYEQDLVPHCVSKLYYRVASKDWLMAYTSLFNSLRMNIDGVERTITPWPKWAITTRIDARDYWQCVWQAACCHYTQLPSDRVLVSLSEEDHKQLWSFQEYYRAISYVNAGRQVENDLFEGL